MPAAVGPGGPPAAEVELVRRWEDAWKIVLGPPGWVGRGAAGGAGMNGKRVLGIVLAGAPGRRLTPLTAERAKAAVPFGGLYRLVDFALSNLVNGGIRRICVLTQYKSHSLDRHLAIAWGLSSTLGDQVIPVPAQQWTGPRWQAGSADAIYQSLSLLDEHRPDLVVVCGADHVYRMDPAQMIDQHLARGAGVTVSAIPMPRARASDFGVVQAAADGHSIEAFMEKPASPASRAGHPDESLVSMGIYVFDPDTLIEALHKDAADDDSAHSMGGNVIPRLARDGAAQAYDFRTNEVPGASAGDCGYWRELGTIDSYFNAHMDLRAVIPPFNLYNDRWPIVTRMACQPPAKFVHSGRRPARTGGQQRGQQRRDIRRADKELSPVAGSPRGRPVAGEPSGDLGQHPRPPQRRRGERHPGQGRGRLGGRRGGGGQGPRPRSRIHRLGRRRHRGQQGASGGTVTGPCPT